jgi:hypothetical protein
LKVGTLQNERALPGYSESFASAHQKRINNIERIMVVLQQEKEKLSDQNYARTAMDEAYAVLWVLNRSVPANILHAIAQYSVDDHPSPGHNRVPMHVSRLVK